MNELMEKIGIHPALPGEKMRDALTKERRKTYAQWHDSANNPRQKLLLRMRLEDIRKAETALHNKGILPKETSTVSANLSLIMALLPIAFFWVIGTIYPLWGFRGWGFGTAAIYALLGILNSSEVLVLTAGILSLIALAALIIGIRSFLLTTGSYMQKIFSITFSLGYVLFFAIFMHIR